MGYISFFFISLAASFSFGQTPPPLTPPNCFSTGSKYTLDCAYGPYFNSYYSGATQNLQWQLWHAKPKKRREAQRAIYDDTYAKNLITNEIVPKVDVVNSHPACCGISTPSGQRKFTYTDPNSSENIKGAEQTCAVQEVSSLPGSHQFGSDFIEAVASDPDPKKSNVVYGITADLSSKVPAPNQAMYVSKSTDGGKTWAQVAKVDSKYFDAAGGEGLRNGLSVSPGGKDFVITTQKGAFQILPQSDSLEPVIKHLEGPNAPAGVTKVSSDGTKMYVSYGDLGKQGHIVTYDKNDVGSWKYQGEMVGPNNLDILSMQLDPNDPSALYVGTGDQAYHFDPKQKKKWSKIQAVGGDSAIHGMSTVGGLHLATCWGVYNPLSGEGVKKVTDPKALSKIRAYGIEVDPLDPNREVITTATGVYTSYNAGKAWKKLEGLPDVDFRTAHFNSEDGTVLVSGTVGTYIANPFSKNCQ